MRKCSKRCKSKLSGLYKIAVSNQKTLVQLIELKRRISEIESGIRLTDRYDGEIAWQDFKLNDLSKNRITNLMTQSSIGKQ